MKLVWVNQFNADGSVKPMNEWQLRTTKSEDKFYFKDKYSDFDGFLEADCKFEAKDRMGPGYLIEYIGDQRGDGWLYVADGEMPPCLTEVWISDGYDYDKDYVDIDSNTGAEYFANSGDSVVCWQPIQPAKHLN